MSPSEHACRSFQLDDRPVAAIFRTPVFNRSETFVQTQATRLVRYQPLVVGLENKGHVVPELAGRILLARGRKERLAFAAGRTAAMARRLRPLMPVLVHAHFGTDALRALPLARALRLPLLTTLHGYEVSRSRARLLASGRFSWADYGLRRRRLMQGGELFLAVSDAVRDRAVLQGYPEDRILTHYLGVDLTRFGRPTKAGRGLVLHVGRLVEKKGTDLLLEAFGAVRAACPDARLVVIGDGPLRPALERKARALGHDRAVRFLGAMAPVDVAAWMQRAQVLAVPSVTARDGDAEGLPTVLVEAAAASLPAVGSRHSGIPEAIVDGETGFVVAEGDRDALAARLSALLVNDELRQQLAAAARRLAEARFDAARQSARLEELYDSVRCQMRP